MGSRLRYLLVGLALSAAWLLIALRAIPGGLAQAEEFSLYGWPALGLLFLAPLALIWLALGLVRLQRRVSRLQDLLLGRGAEGTLAPAHPPRRAGLDAEPPFAEAWRESRGPEHLSDDPRATRAPGRVAYSALDPLPGDSRSGDSRPGEPEAGEAGRRQAAPERQGADRYAEAADRTAPPQSPRRAPLPEPHAAEADTTAEPLPDDLEPHRPARATRGAPRLEALPPSYREAADPPVQPLTEEQLARYEARAARELNAITMDLASIVSNPVDYDRALDALNGGVEGAFFQLLARDFQVAESADLRQQLAMVGGNVMLDTYLEKYEQLLVVAYRSDPGGRSVKRLVEAPMGRLHQAIESYRQSASRG
ncbi:MAG: hypothetical protein WD341_01140 [Tistlia sp.]|uniref:hypothetical protein n=1 Tax=Tistlia sp. TaxID=3057121 RepID=UPI0034A3143C